MNNHLIAVCFIILPVLLIQACDVNIGMSNTSSVPPIVLTITAQAAVLQQGNQQPVNPSNTNPPAQQNLGLQSSTPTITSGQVSAPAANNPAQSGPVTVMVTVETNCRKGPGLIYEAIYSMSVSDVAEVIGKNTSTNYWIIKIPNGGGATCWLWGQYATVTGNTSALVEFATPIPPATATATKKPTPTAALTNTSSPAPSGSPAAPSNVQVTISCVDQGNSTNKISGSVSWTDNSNNELAFGVLVPGIAHTLAPNTTSDNFSFVNSKNHPFQKAFKH